MTLLDPPARALAAPAVPRPPVALPDGQRTLLLCDMVDSTALALRLGDAASAALWAAHDRVARDLLRDWNGLEIDKSDGMLALFARTDEAVGFALAYHRALARLPQAVSCRVGLHVGPVLLRRNHGADVARGAKPLEVDGLAKSIAARVMAVAQGGQTLLSAQALAALQALAPGHRRLQSHGYWQLKGVAEPVRLFEVGDEHTRFEPPPDGPKAWRVLRRGTLWLPARQVRHRLPAERDRFIGRQAPLLDLAQRIESGARLVSVLGPGGIGKTRLAVHFAWSWLGEFPGGLWFCDLTAAATPKASPRPWAPRASWRPARPTWCSASRPRWPSAAAACCCWTTSSRSPGTPSRRSAAGSTVRPRPAWWSPAANCWACPASRR